MNIKVPQFGFHMATNILLLVSALCIFSVSAAVFVSIDCGSSDIYTDENLIVWAGDNDYIQNGESHVVQNANSVSRVMDTLRAFTSRNKNCYTVVGTTKGERVIVRASFNYGNYDNRSTPPTFDLQFDGNHWVTVETSSTDYVYYEVIYVVKGDTLSVCVAQTRTGHVPFMSALEVRSMEPTMYSQVDRSYPLLLIRRVAYGANATVRYIDDPYDRIWTPVLAGNGLTNVASDAFLIETGVPDRPPPAVLRNAVSAVTPSDEIHLLMGTIRAEIPVYVNMYFSEVTQLDATQRRSFQVLVNNEPLLDRPVLPMYGNCTQLYTSNLTVTPNTTFALVPTNDSTLPPLVNAMEVFLIGDVLTDGTNSKDVEGLASLQNAFAALQDWSGDPCLPASYSWDWINCTADPTPRVSALYLSGFDLSGELPDFSSMDALVTIDFHNNSLEGPIPDFLATLPNLKQLNLASNQFSGPIPNSLSRKNSLNLTVTGNPDLCTSEKSSCKTTTSSSPSSDMNPGMSSPGSNRKKKKGKLPVILGTTIPIPIILSALFWFFTKLHNKRKNAAVATYTTGQQGGNTPQASPTNPQMISKMGQSVLNEIKKNMEDQIINNVDLADQTNDHQPNNGTNVES